MRKVLFSVAAAAALGLVTWTPAPAQASWLSELIHQFTDRDDYPPVQYYQPYYGYYAPAPTYDYYYRSPVYSYGYDSPGYSYGYYSPGYSYGYYDYAPEYVPGYRYDRAPYVAPDWGYTYVPSYYGRWYSPLHAWHEMHEHHGWEGRYGHEWHEHHDRD